ncbi:MAG TPA: protein translocase subunit SecF [Candidatus Limnocylindria bacterium]|jgi:preprotein translocase subunit SecF|nr:protein translocase subunit SecF [Candidatus Limnocylindria bacterium]
MFDIVGKRRWYFAFSALITIPGLIFIFLGGLKPSVDFTGGTVWQVRYADDPSPEEVRDALVELGHPEAVVRRLSDGFLEIRTAAVGLLPPQTPIPSFSFAPSPSGASASASPTPNDTPAPSGGSATASASPSPSPTPVPSAAATLAPIPDNTPFARIENALEDQFGEPQGGRPRSVTTIGALIGAELIRSSLILIIVGEIVIMAYLAIRFGIRFGVAAIIALLHDVVVVIGIFAILGYFFGLEFDALFVTALLTIIGFSVHDTIVVFDRIRENRIRHAGEPFGAIVNHSILQTIGRSINTSLTVAVTLSALLLLGPLSIRTFTLALLIGVVSGTYSSIFNASQLLVSWYEWDANRKANPSGSRTVRPLSR